MKCASSEDYLRLVLANEDIGLLEQLFRQIVDVIRGVDDLLDASVDENLGTHGTGICRRVDRAVLHRYPEISCLDDRVLLRVDPSAQLVPGPRGDVHLLPDATQLLAVLGSFRGSVVSGGNEPLLLDNDRPHLPSDASGPLRGQKRHLHEIFVVVRSFHDNHQ